MVGTKAPLNTFVGREIFDIQKYPLNSFCYAYSSGVTATTLPLMIRGLVIVEHLEDKGMEQLNLVTPPNMIHIPLRHCGEYNGTAVMDNALIHGEYCNNQSGFDRVRSIYQGYDPKTEILRTFLWL